MDRFSERVLAAVSDTLRRMRLGRMERRRQNYAEIARILRMAGISDHGTVDGWIAAETACEEPRDARDRAQSARRRSQRIRTRSRLRIIEGRGTGAP